MKPAAFDYHRPTTLDQALERLAEHEGDAKPLAGGQSLIPAMNFRLARPAVLVDLNRLSELAYIRSDPDGLRIGAMTRQRSMETSDLVRRAAPLVSEAMPFIAHPQIRNRGTVGGSIAHADPAAELPAVMVALGATFRARGRTGVRAMAAEEFFTGLFTTALAPHELLVEIVVPPPAPGTGSAFVEMARRHGDYALAGVAAVVTLERDGRCRAVRIALFSVGDGPVLARAAAGLLEAQVPSPELFRAVADRASRDIDPPGDIHASSAYRRHLAGVLVRRALTRAWERARGAA
jgi:6-hydroxypseudooxynicotine dehydrogenase subunit alpha